MTASRNNGAASRVRPSRTRWWAASLAWYRNHGTIGFSLLAAFAALLLYSHALKAPFVYDDYFQIVRAPELSSFRATFNSYALRPADFTNSFRGIGGQNYRPIFWLSLSIDRHLWGLQSSGYHLTNIAIHWINGVLLYLLLRRFAVSSLTASIAALIWTGMPINSEAVAWVSAREYLLCTMFLILALHAAHAYIMRREKRYLLVAFVLSTCALLSHESGVLLLPSIVLAAYCTNVLARRTTAIILATIIASDGLVLYVRHLIGVHGGGGGPAFISVGLAFWKYWAWMLAPIHMSIQRSLSTPAAVYSPQAIVALSCLVAFCVSVVLLRNSVPVVAAGLAWAIIAVLPYCGIVFIYQGMAERYLYLASPGIAIAVAGTVQYKGKLAIPIRCVACLWIVWGVYRLERRVREWADPVALYESSLQATPDPMLFYDLGWAWRERGDLQNALVAYKEAADRKPDYEEAQASIGQVLYLLGRPEEAIEPYLRALALQKTDVDTRVDFALALAQVGRKQEAEQQFKQALVSAPQNISALDGLGSLYVAQGSYEQALELFQRAIRYNPNDSTAYYNIAAIYQGIGDRTKAIEFYKKVLTINPNDAEVLADIMRLAQNQ